MNCSKCGTEIVEGAKFCTSCSNRVDNMVVCPVCETENDKNFTFCFACGSRLDGKRFCKNCNTEILENYTFCPVCGERVSVVFNPSIKHKNAKDIYKTKSPKTKKYKQPSTEKGFFKVEKLLTPSLLIFGLLVLLLSSFFIGVQVRVGNMSDSTLNQIFDFMGIKKNVFYFFGDAYKDLASESAELNFSSAHITEKVSLIAQTVVYACNILLSFIMLIIGVVNYCSGLAKREEVCLGKYFAWSFAGFLLSLGLMLSNGFFLNIDYLSSVTKISVVLKTVPNLFTWLAIIITVSVGAGAVVLNLVAKCLKDFDVKYLVKKSLIFASVLFLVIALISICKSYFVLIDYQTEGMTLDIGVGAIFMSSLFESLSTSSYKREEILFIVIMLLGIVLLLSLALAFATKSIFDKKQRPILSIIFTVLSIVSLVVAYIFLGDLPKPLGKLGLSGEKIIQGPILELVFTLLALGVSIACVCINTKKQIEE